MNSVELRQAMGILFISEVPEENFILFWDKGRESFKCCCPEMM